MPIAASVVIAIALYCAIGTTVGVLTFLYDPAGEDIGFTAVVGGIFWPVTMWILIGAAVIGRVMARRERIATEQAEQARLLREAGF